MTQEQKYARNKAVVARLFDTFFSTLEGNPSRVGELDEYVLENYIQHNPLAAQGREGLRHFLANDLPKLNARHSKSPLDSPLLALNMIAEGDFVVRQEVRKDYMLVDVFRLEDGWLAEHWDALRVEPGAPRWPGF